MQLKEMRQKRVVKSDDIVNDRQISYYYDQIRQFFDHCVVKTAK